MSKPIQFSDFPDILKPGYGPYPAIVERIVDGDTINVLVDMGLNEYPFRSIRLMDVNAPELFSGTNREAGAAAKAKLMQLCPPGTAVLLETYQDHNSFDRYLGWLLKADGTNVNDAMNAWLEEMAW